MLSTRTVTGKVLYSDGSPWVGGVVQFLLDPSVADAAQYPSAGINATTNNLGFFSTSLLTSRFFCFLPDGEGFLITVPAGTTAIDLAQLRLNPSFDTDIRNAIAIHNLDPNAHPNLTIGGGSGGMSWSVVSTSQTMAIGRGYIVNSSSLVLLTLPAAAAIGSLISVVDQDIGGWRITQSDGQSIRVGDKVTTVGITGRVSSTGLGDAIDLLCIATNQWVAIGLSGVVDVA